MTKREIKFRAWNTFDNEMIKTSDEAIKLMFIPRPDKYIFLQFTGLLDKNGKEIFEGDILDHYATSGAVIFEDGMFCLNMQAKVNFGHRQPLCYIDVNQAEVIGNVWENKELLNDSK
jgi:uncharacterized phage protein (TIGR01671 family)